MSAPVVLHVAAIPLTARMLLLPQLTHLREAGYDVRLACGSLGRPWDLDLLPFRPLDVAFSRSGHPIQIAKALRDLTRAARTTKADIVHLHTPSVALPARLLPRGVLGSGTQVVYTVHGFPHQWDSPRARDKVLERLERLLARRTDLMLFQSREDLDRAAAARFPSVLRPLGNGVEDGWFNLAAAPPRAGAPLRLLFIGRMVAEKGVVELLEAVARVPDVELVMVGDAVAQDRGQLGARITQIATSPALRSRVRMLGLLERRAVMSAMEEAHALVLPSHREGLPRSVIEALAAGRPAVVTDIRGSRELIRHEDNGLIVPPRDVELLAAALERLSTEPGLLPRLTARARLSVDPERRESQVFARLVHAYREIGVGPPA